MKFKTLFITLMIFSSLVLSGCLKLSNDSGSTPNASSASSDLGTPTYYDLIARKDLNVDFVKNKFPNYTSVSVHSIGQGSIHFSRKDFNDRDTVNVQASGKGYKVVVVVDGREVTRIMR